MANHHSRIRIEKLFSGMQPAASQPLSGIGHDCPEDQPRVVALTDEELRFNSPAILLQEVKTLRARVLELETSLQEFESRPFSAPVLYEKEEVGFAYVDDQLLPVQSIQPKVQEEAEVIKTPLVASGRAIGEVQVAPPSTRPLTQDDFDLAQAIAQQASLQIENLRLLAATERARAEAEEATRQFAHQNWDNFLDAIHNSERIGYVYDQASVEPFSNPAPGQYDHEETMQVLDQHVGRLLIKGNGSLTEADKSLIGAVAKQVGQQVENIRLLADASRARAEAEEATRRLTRENWQSYKGQRDESGLGFVYDSNRVIPLAGFPPQQELNLIQPLRVRGETIGQLAVAGWKELSREDVDLTAAIATQVSTHLESLRLLETAEFELAERTRAEQELLKLRLGMDRATDAVFLTDTKGTILYVNPAFERIYGWAREEAIGQTPRIIKSGLIPQERYKEFWTALLNRQTIAGEIVNKTKDGRLVPIEASNNPILNADGEVIGFLGLHRDITERKQAQEIIAKRATQLEAVATLSTTASTLLDPDKLLQSVVDLTKERFGLYHAHVYLADKSWETLLLAAGAGEVGRQMVAEGWNIPIDHDQSIVAGAARNRKPIIANHIVRDKNSSFLSNQLLTDTRSEMAVPMIAGQELLGVFDVQADKEDFFSEDDANIYTTLAAQVAVALQNARLYVQQTATVAQLRELDRLKSSFLANMSHELRTPLNSILGFADVMLEGIDGDLTEYMDNDLRLIQKNGQHLLHLINDVLDMAKIESGRMNLNPEKFKIHNMLEEVTSITSTLASEKNLPLFIDEDSDCDIEVYADNTRIRQVMINLVNNAIKFTEQGKIVISANAREGGHVLVTVKDTGIGIPPDKLEAIFQEFTQVDSSTTRKVGGTGLGLPISRRLVEMHGGRLWAESTGNPGEGSAFFVELPIEARIAEVVEK